MISDRLARDYLEQARVRARALATFIASGGHAVIVRESHDIVELALKGALRFVGIDPPKRHDVHDVLERFVDRLPPEWATAISDARRDLDWLAEQRSPAFYGNEADDIPASALFGEPEARRAMAVAERFLELFARLLAENR